MEKNYNALEIILAVEHLYVALHSGSIRQAFQWPNADAVLFWDDFWQMKSIVMVCHFCCLLLYFYSV